MDQAEALKFVREIAKGKSGYRTSKILDVSWPTARNWLSKNPAKISYLNLKKLEALRGQNRKP